jgi:hypothetical protein
MNVVCGARWLSIAFLALACQAAPAAEHPSMTNMPRRLLFIGNSFTYFNGGLEHHVQQFARKSPALQNVVADRATKGGATLQILQGLPWVHDKLKEGHFDVVILQDDIPELTGHTVEPFYHQARLFHAEINALGGKAVLFMAWPYERLNWVSLETISEAHRTIGRELGIPVAPVGLAFRNALQARPTLAMLGPDHEHETIHGTYLAAAVLYSTIFEANPEGLTYHPDGVSDEESKFLQSIAWKTVQDWNRN